MREKGFRLAEDHKRKIGRANKVRMKEYWKTHEPTQNQFTRGHKKGLGRKHTEESKRLMSKNNPRILLGQKLPETTRKKISAANKGRIPSATTKEKIRQKLIGHKYSEESKRKMSLSQRRIQHNLIGLKEYNKTHGSWNKGLTKEKDLRLKIVGEKNRIKLKGKVPKSAFKKGQYAGEKHPQWKGGVTPINLRIRSSSEYKLWRTAVFVRDNYTCIWCGLRGIVIHADHIKPFSLFPELRFAIDNGRTLCIGCHKKTDTYGEKAKRWREHDK